MKVVRCLMMIILCVVSLSTAFARDSIRLGVYLEPPGLDPSQTAAATAGQITYGNLFEGLVIINAQGEVAPRLASRWDVSDDGLTYRFQLRRGVRFHDNNPFNAEIARFSIARILAEDSTNPQKAVFSNIAGVEVESHHLLVIRLQRPDPFFLANLALPAAVMVHPLSVQHNSTLPIGTGPYRFVEWLPKRVVKLAANERYWGQKPTITVAEFLFMESSAGTESFLAEGLIDGLIGVSRVSNRFVMHPDYHMIPRSSESKMILAINNARPPFDDIRVRRALAHGINREALMGMYGNQFKADFIGSHFSPDHPAYVDLSQVYAYDPAYARELLQAAGVAQGLQVTLTLPPTDYGRTGGIMIADDLEAIGFSVELEPLSWLEWMDQVFTQAEYSLSLIIHVEPMDINIYARDNYYFNYDNNDFKEIWQRVLNASSTAELYRSLAEAQRQITEDAVNVFLFMRPERNIIHRNLKGIWTGSYISSFVLEDLYWANH